MATVLQFDLDTLSLENVPRTLLLIVLYIDDTNQTINFNLPFLLN